MNNIGMMAKIKSIASEEYRLYYLYLYHNSFFMDSEEEVVAPAVEAEPTEEITPEEIPA